MLQQKNNNFKYELVRLEWFDIKGAEDTWVHEDEIKNHDVAYCVDVGFLYHYTDHKIWLFSSYSFNDDGSLDVGNLTVYPRGCIREIIKI